MLRIAGPMYWISLYTALITTWTCIGLALGFGLYFADLKTENRNAAMEPGAILFLFCAVLYQFVVILTGLLPAFRLTRRWLRQTSMAALDLASILGWGIGVAVVSILLVLLLCRRAIERTEQ